MSIQDALGDATNGEAGLFILPYGEEHATKSLAQQLHRQVEPTPDTATGDDERDVGGVIRRSNEFRSRLGPVLLESIALAGMELAKSVERRARDLHRNTFPLLVPAFEAKCEGCNAEYDDAVDRCRACGATDLREPDPQQRTAARQFFCEVNKEGQSLSELYQSLARDAGRQGGWVHLVRYQYGVLNGAVVQEPLELVRADPKRVKPVVDEAGRIGGYWWACPIHRDDYDREPGACETCGADKREVFFAETEGVQRATSVETVYFEDEVIDYAAFNERLAGHDWLSPVEHLWKRQAILAWMNSYAAAFFDDTNTDRYPGRLLILHTTNRQAVEKQLAEASDDREQDPYANGVLYNEIPREGSGGQDQAQVLDLMNDELMGQAPELKKDFKSDIRGVYGQVDVQDSELEDAGGLNNEGLQLTVRDDYLASEHASLRDGPLQKLMRVLGYDDWELRFVPRDEPEEAPAPSDVVQAAEVAERAGIPYAVEDGRFRVADTDGVVEPEPTPEATPDETPLVGGEQATTDATLGQQAGDGVAQALETLEAMHRELCFPDAIVDGDLTQEAREPFFADDEDMPQFVAELIQEALRSGAVYLGDYDASNVTGQAVQDFFREKLDQPQGWSIESLSRDFADRFNLEFEDAVDTLRTQLTSVLNEAREQGYRRQGDLDERRFKWVGPIDDQKTDASWEILERTNPDHGGTPRPLDELKDIVHEARERHWDDFDGGEWADGYNDRDTFVEHFD